MGRTVDKLTFQPILNPTGHFIVIVHSAFSLFQQRIIHVAFCGGNDQFELLISAADAVFSGIVIGNVPPAVDVLSEPKSSTATDLLPCVEL
jgi:hypothetical protein